MQDDLALAQERLARSLERARASEDRELAGRVRDEGSQLVHQLNGLLRMSRLHSLDNRAFEKPLKDAAHSLAGLAELLGTLTLALVEDQVYLNEIRIRLEDQQGGAAALAEELARHGLGGLRFYRAPSEQELRGLVVGFAGKPDAKAPLAALRAVLEREGLESIELLGRSRVRVVGEAGGLGAADGAGALKRCAQAVSDAFDNLGRGRLFNPLPARRAVAELLAAGAEREGLATDPPACPAHVAHALRVCRLALLVGREAGMSKGLLQDLGVAALLHDVGYAEADAESATPGFFRHASGGARLLLRQRGFHVAKVRRVRAVLGHHSAATGRRRPPSPLARLIRIVEDYDTLVRRGGLTPPEALTCMMSAAGTAYDPLLMQAFVNALGVCPPGTRVTLTDGSSGIVIEPGGGASGFARPVVAVDRMADGRVLVSPLPVDLAQGELGLSGVPDAPPAVATAVLASLEPDLNLVDPSSPAPASSPAAELAGAVAQGVPIRLIRQAHLERRSGRLKFESGEERCALRFVQGDVVGVWTNRKEHGLAALLRSGGLVEPEKLEEAIQQAARTRRPLGGTLREGDLIEAEWLEQALGAQARVVVCNLVQWDGGRYEFSAGEGPQPEEDEGLSVSTDALIVGAVRALHDPDVVRFALGDLDRVPLRSQDPARRTAENLLGSAETKLLERVDGRTSARSVLKEAGLPAEQAQRALLMLLGLGLVEYPPS